MAATGTRYYCKDCGHEELRWLGRCPGCGAWNSLAEVKTPRKGKSKGSQGFQSGQGAPAARGAMPLAQVSSAVDQRLPVVPAEVARVLGGGLVTGSVVLLGGEPGVGKSTLLTGLALDWVRQGIPVTYIAGEESPGQIRMRAERLGFSPDQGEGFSILPEVHLESLVAALAERHEAGGPPGVIIADSIQTLHSEQVDSFPGSPGQIRFCGGVLADFSRRTGHPLFLVGHVTKTGDLAGPKLLEHMVDTVLYFEGSGGGAVRLVRAVKNRFGNTGELAVLEMRADGLAPVDQAGLLFLGDRASYEPGAVVCAVRNGSRIFLVEVQALVSPSRYGTPQRVVQGVDGKRVALLAAILEKRGGLDLAGCDIFIKVAGGGRLEDPGADLALLTALASSLREKPVPRDTLVLGEVGLTGEIRPVTDLEARLREAAHHGFRRAVVPEDKSSVRAPKGLKVTPAPGVAEAVALAMQPAGPRAAQGRG